jgi:cob(I)alamin adenosyltransferase
MENQKPGRRGLVHVYTGEGKGKTTSSLGLALRSLGHGFKVYIIQFMKGGRYYGEVEAIENQLKGIEIAQFGQGCPHADLIRTGEMTCIGCGKCFVPFEGEKSLAVKALEFARKIINTGKYDLVILDEINVAMGQKQINVQDVLELIISKPTHVELVLTGRNVPSEIIAVADYVTEMRMIKHPFNKGVDSRLGIEY